jgi:hypothetical protein
MPSAGPLGIGEEIHRQAEQQREQQHRRAVVLAEEGGGRGDDGARHRAGEQGLGARGQCAARDGRDHALGSR